MALGHLVSHLGQPQSQDSSEPLVVTEAQDIYMTMGTVSRSRDPDMALVSSLGPDDTMSPSGKIWNVMNLRVVPIFSVLFQFWYVCCQSEHSSFLLKMG